MTIQIKTFKNSSDNVINKFISNHQNARIVSYNPIIVEYTDNQLTNPYLTLTGKRVKFGFRILEINQGILSENGMRSYIASTISFFNEYIYIDYDGGRIIKDLGRRSDDINMVKIIGVYDSKMKFLFYADSLTLDGDGFYTEYQGNLYSFFTNAGQYIDWCQTVLEKHLSPIQSHIAYNNRTKAFIGLGNNIKNGLDNVSGSILEGSKIVAVSNVLAAEINANASDRINKTIKRK